MAARQLDEPRDDFAPLATTQVARQDRHVAEARAGDPIRARAGHATAETQWPTNDMGAQPTRRMLAFMVELAALNDLTVLGILAAVTLLHELGVPVPMSPAALVVGARAATGAIDPALPVVAIVAATLVGNAVWFAAGRRYGLEVLRLAGRLSPSVDKHARQGADKFDRWGPWLLVIGRFVPGATLVTPPLAGAFGMRWSKFLLLTTAGSVLHGVVIVGAGVLLRHEVESALDSLGDLSGYALVGLAGALAVYLAWRWRRGATAPIAESAQRVDATQAATAAIVPDVRAPQGKQRRVALSLGLDRLTHPLRQFVPAPCSAC